MITTIENNLWKQPTTKAKFLCAKCGLCREVPLWCSNQLSIQCWDNS